MLPWGNNAWQPGNTTFLKLNVASLPFPCHQRTFIPCTPNRRVGGLNATGRKAANRTKLSSLPFYHTIDSLINPELVMPLTPIMVPENTHNTTWKIKTGIAVVGAHINALLGYIQPCEDVHSSSMYRSYQLYCMQRPRGA